MIKFPSIEQFRNVIRHVKTNAQYVGRDENGDAIIDQSRPIPTLKFRGTVKLHGTNAGIVYDVPTNTITYQSRERVLTLTQDNAGFMLAQMKNEDVWHKYFECLIDHDVAKIAIFGEWCGRGIQKGVAVSELDKMFVIFACKLVYIDGTSEWINTDGSVAESIDLTCIEDFRVFDISEFPTYEIDIDFNHPELAQNKMIEITEAVEKECPVGKYFGVSGVGEGVVWTCVSTDFDLIRSDSGTWFKVKGEKHSASKVKTLAAVDVEAIQALKDFVDATVTEQRLEQGVDNLVREQLKPLDMTSMGDFIRWVYNDVVKEETDTIVVSGFDPKKLGGPIANKARPWFIKRINS